jgi:hypothetical protein
MHKGSPEYSGLPFFMQQKANPATKSTKVTKNTGTKKKKAIHRRVAEGAREDMRKNNPS